MWSLQAAKIIFLPSQMMDECGIANRSKANTATDGNGDDIMNDDSDENVNPNVNASTARSRAPATSSRAESVASTSRGRGRGGRGSRGGAGARGSRGAASTASNDSTPTVRIKTKFLFLEKTYTFSFNSSRILGRNNRRFNSHSRQQVHERRVTLAQQPTKKWCTYSILRIVIRNNG